MELNFTFTVDDTNLILAALSNMPYNQVASLIDKFKAQAVAQMTPPEPPKSTIRTYSDGRMHDSATGEIVMPDGSRGHDMVYRMTEEERAKYQAESNARS